jgi:hypothetical protein
MVLYAGFTSTSTHLLICCVRALQHYQASSAFSLGSEIPMLWTLLVSPSRIHDKHQHLHPRRFRAFYFALLGIIKSGPCHRPREDMDHGLTAFPHHHHTFPLSMHRIQHVASLCAIAVNSGWLC